MFVKSRQGLSSFVKAVLDDALSNIKHLTPRNLTNAPCGEHPARDPRASG